MMTLPGGFVGVTPVHEAERLGVQLELLVQFILQGIGTQTQTLKLKKY